TRRRRSKTCSCGSSRSRRPGRAGGTCRRPAARGNTGGPDLRGNGAMTPLFGLLIIERDPYTFGNFLGLLQAWLQDAGGFAALGLLAYLVYALRTPTAQAASA